MKCSRFIKSLILFTIFLGATSCKTSRDIQKDKSLSKALDPSGVQTLEAPPVEEAVSSSDKAVKKRTFTHEDMQMKLAVALGEIENLRYQLQQQNFQQEDSLKSIKEENLRLKEALNSVQTRAVAPAKTVRRKKGNAADSLWKQGIRAIKKSEYEEALLAMNTLLSSYPKSSRIWGATLTSGMLQYQMKQYKEAALRFNEAIDLTAKRKRGVSLPWYFQGMTFYKMGKKEDAELFWDELQRKYPRSLVNRKLGALKKKKSLRLPSNLFKDVAKWEAFL